MLTRAGRSSLPAVNAALMFCQCLGSLIVILARVGSPDRVRRPPFSCARACRADHPSAPDLQLGPYTVFPNLALWDRAIDGMWGLPVIYPLFWICLVCQIGIVVGCEWLLSGRPRSR